MQPLRLRIKLTTSLWAAVAVKLAVLAAVCAAAPFAGTALLVTNLLLSMLSPLGRSGWALTVMLAVNSVLWMVASLATPGLSARGGVVAAFAMTAAVWLPFPVVRGGG